MSFYEKQKKRISKELKEPLVEMVLQLLPHLQLSQTARDDLWEVIAIRMNSFLTGKVNESDGKDFPVLTGNFVREVYEDIMKKFKAENSFTLKNRNNFPLLLQDRVDFILLELYDCSLYDIEVMTKLSKERFENTCKKMMAEPESGNNVLSAEKEANYKKQIDDMQRSIDKKDAQIGKLTVEIKRLLDLNHDLLDNGLRGN